MPSNVDPLDKLDIDSITEYIKEVINKANTEEYIRIKISNLIEEKILKPLKDLGEIDISEGEYEYTLASGKRVDALYGHVIIEYKGRGVLSNDSNKRKVKKQIIGYIKDIAGDESNYDKVLGIIISDKIGFVRYNKYSKEEEEDKKWELTIYDIERDSIIMLIEAFRGLMRKTLSAEELVKDFGINSHISKKIIKLFYKKLLNTKNERTKMLFKDWMDLFKQATGYNPEKLKEIKELLEDYQFEKSNINYDALIFSIHTYYALIMKLIAAEVASLNTGGQLLESYIGNLINAYAGGIEALKDVLRELESGDIFKKFLGIDNFLEEDYFSWYVEEIDNELAYALYEVVKILSNYEMATPQLKPESTRDLLKDLYHNLIPKDIRHDLGEYYTPDWLAELILDEVGLSYENLKTMGKENRLKPLEIRVLDPACGSGTFLILYINRLKRYAREHFLKPSELAPYIIKNVVGYDLNPLAVLAARTNFLLATVDLIRSARREGKLKEVEIPIYLADSIMIKEPNFFNACYTLSTKVGELKIPVNIAQNTELLRKILNHMKICLKNKCTYEVFEDSILSSNLTSEEKEEFLKGKACLKDLYNKLLKLEQQGKNGIWISIIKNTFAPMLKGKFDYVIGNPPWVSWENLPDEYRRSSEEFWKKYGLTKTINIGAFKKDLSMLFLVRCFDLYLEVGGKLGFVITFTAFKSLAGAGFREFLAKNTKIHVIHDLVSLKPFEGATNMTGAIIIEKVCELKDIKNNDCTIIKEIQKENIKGIKNVIWIGKKIDPKTHLDDVKRITKRHENLVMIPLIPNDPSSPWMQVKSNIINSIRKIIDGNQYYKAYEGILTALNQVYFVKVLGKTSNNMLIVTNPSESGQKKKVKQVKDIVEPDLVYPLIRGKDVKKWYVEFKDRYIILPHDIEGDPIPHHIMKTKYPYTYQYFYQFFNDLINRSGGFLKQKMAPYKKYPFDKAEKMTVPFYYVMNNVRASLAPYKVVWKEITGSFACAVVKPIDEKPVVPDHKLMLVEVESPDEAYYIAGVLNSIIVRSIIESYTYVMARDTHILDIIKVSKFDPNNNLHKKIAELSKRAHELAKCIYSNNKPDYCKNINAEKELKKVEDEIDLAVAELYGITKEELEGFKELMNILSGK